MSLTLHTLTSNYVVWKAQVCAAYGDVKLEVQEHKNPAAIGKMTPAGRSPVLQTPHGNVSGSNTIARYLSQLRPEAGLNGGSFFEKMQVEQWVDFANNELEPARAVWLYPVLGQMTFNVRTYNQAKKSMSNALKALDNHLKTNTFLVGQRVTVADISIALALVDCYTTIFNPKYSEGYGNVLRWFNTIVNQPVVKGVIGAVTFATEEKKAPAPVKKVVAKQEPKKKAEPAPAPKPVEKKKDPRTLLPPSPVNLDAEKIAFFKNPGNFGLDFFPQFWEKFDTEGYSLYLSNYQYDNDNKIFWRTQNAMGGFLQRASSEGKYAFGVMCIHGPDDKAEPDTPPFKICGAWMFRGQDVPEQIMFGDGEWYDWIKLDAKKKEDQAKFEELMIGKTVRGDTVQDRRYFK